MNYKNKKKYTPFEKEKIMNRFKTKFEEYKLLSLEELKDIFNTAKISSTDREALVRATNVLMQEKIAKMSAEQELESNNKALEQINAEGAE
jgi:hypothetical protein